MQHTIIYRWTLPKLDLSNSLAGGRGNISSKFHVTRKQLLKLGSREKGLKEGGASKEGFKIV